MYVALRLYVLVWSKSLYLGKKVYPVQFFLPCTYINFQIMGHPTLVFRPAHNEFSDNVPPYTCMTMYVSHHFYLAVHSKDLMLSKNTWYSYEKYPTSPNCYFSVTFTDFQWLFQAKCHFPGSTSNDFSRQGLYSMTFPGLYKPCADYENQGSDLPFFDSIQFWLGIILQIEFNSNWNQFQYLSIPFQFFFFQFWLKSNLIHLNNKLAKLQGLKMVTLNYQLPAWERATEHRTACTSGGPFVFAAQSRSQEHIVNCD